MGFKPRVLSVFGFVAAQPAGCEPDSLRRPLAITGGENVVDGVSSDCDFPKSGIGSSLLLFVVGSTISDIFNKRSDPLSDLDFDITTLYSDIVAGNSLGGRRT